ncbi:MAG: aldo/keto reductase, partial [Kiritimatiellia bacterium]|nr:aldo/keto reductase [Kiritimatiellia bacterium]
MKKNLFREYNLSQLMLGTVQFGMSYGIANKTGQPSYQTVLKILENAVAHGVNCLDTASAYGDSEEALGRALRELGIADKIVVVTKVPAMNDNLQPKQADSFIEEAVKTSLKRLQLEVLPICLFHQERDAVYAESLLRMKKKGLVKHIGISANSPEAA